MSEGGRSIWDVVLHGDVNAVGQLLDEAGKEPLYLRGPVGEQPIHMCFLYNSPHHKHLARYLIDRYPEQASCVYKGPIFEGENCLHIAIVNKDLGAIKYLLSVDSSLVHGRATGSFFAPGKPCHFGELPLGFAACTNQRAVMEVLFEHGADVCAVDSQGNTVLHYMVLHKNKEMYDYIEEVDEEQRKRTSSSRPPLKEQVNVDGLTPFTLAASTGNVEMFEYLLEKEKQLLWSYGPVVCHLYPLEQLDNWTTSDSTEKRISAIECIVENERLDLLRHPRVSELLDMKWKTYGHSLFFSKLYMTLGFLAVLTMSTVLRYWDPHFADGKYVRPMVWFYVRPLSNAIVFCGVLYKLFTEGMEMARSGVRGYFMCSGCALLENVLSLLACIVIGTAHVLRIYNHPMEAVVMAVGVLISWSYMLFFMFGFVETGPLVVMIFKMIRIDLVRFLLVYSVFLLGFSQAFFTLFGEVGFSAFLNRVTACFLALTGNVSFEDYIESKFPIASVVLLLLFLISVTILLFNLLVAMMGDTYTAVSSEAENQWKLEWARIIFSVESEMDPSLYKKYSYWKEVEGKRYLQVETKLDGYDSIQQDDASIWRGEIPRASTPPPLPPHASLRAKLAAAARKPDESEASSSWRFVYSSIVRGAEPFAHEEEAKEAKTPVKSSSPATSGKKLWKALRNEVVTPVPGMRASRTPSRGGGRGGEGSVAAKDGSSVTDGGGDGGSVTSAANDFPEVVAAKERRVEEEDNGAGVGKPPKTPTPPRGDALSVDRRSPLTDVQQLGRRRRSPKAAARAFAKPMPRERVSSPPEASEQLSPPRGSVREAIAPRSSARLRAKRTL